MKQDHYSLLARTVEEVSGNHAQLRRFIYEFARVKLRKDLYQQFVEGAWSEIEEQVHRLEDAIDRVEADFAQNAPSLPFNSKPESMRATSEQSSHNALVLPPASHEATIVGDDYAHLESAILPSPPYYSRSSSLRIISETSDSFTNKYLDKHLRSTFWRNVHLIIAVVLGVAIYAASDSETALRLLGLNWFDRSTNTRSTNEVKKDRTAAVGEQELSSKARTTIVPNIPIPTEYGVYAITKGKLTELDLIPIKVPDQRVAISASFSTPSHTHLPNGPFQFVVFRRDLMNNAPDRVSVRVVAQVTRALTFDSGGNAKIADIDQSWVIRSNSYQMRVAPVADKPEMIVIRPESSSFVLPTGRYALVLKGLAYDFTLDGPITDTAHCLERADTLNTPIYTECRKR